MKETKVYIDELPESCNECPYHSKGLLFAENEDYIYKTDCRLGFTQNCNLQSLKTHDRELVKQVCEKIRNNVNDMPYYDDRTGYVSPTDVCEMIDELQKEFEK